MSAARTTRKVSEEAMKQKLADLERKKLKQKECDTKALHIVERLLDNPVEEDFLKDACQFISRSHYRDVTEERALGDLCGYPICSLANAKRPDQKYRISTRTNKVYDITERKNFCSDGCYKSSRYLENQIRTTTVWMRDGEERVEFSLLPPGGERGLAGDVVVQHPSAEIAAELAGISLAETATNQSPETSPSSTNEERSTKPENQSRTSNPEPDSHETRTTSKTVAIDSDDDESDNENSDHAAKTESSERKLQDLMELIDKRDKLIKRLRAEANEKSTNEAIATKAVRTETESESSLLDPQSKTGTGPATSRKSDETFDKSIPEIDEPIRTEIPAQKTTKEFLEPRKKIERFLLEWITERTLQYLKGDSEHDRVEAMEKLEFKLKEEERIERVSEREELLVSEPPTSSMPNYEQLKSQSAEFDVKVRSFYSVGRKSPKDGKAMSDDVMSERDADWSPVVPLVDSQSQTAIRRRIVTDALRKTLPSILTSLSLNIDEVTPHLKTLIRTFNLTKENIVLKPGEWTLMAVYLLKLLSEASDVIKEAFTLRRTHIDNVIDAYDVSTDGLSSWIGDLLTAER